MNETLRSRTRVVVTGLGAITPAGQSVAEFWDNLVAGRSGIDFMTLADTQAFDCKVAGEVKNWEPKKFIEHKAARRMARSSQTPPLTSRRKTWTVSVCLSATGAAAIRTSRRAPRRCSIVAE
jgi:3-oxoacyl-[acyl-carrier-protein] synthase II